MQAAIINAAYAAKLQEAKEEILNHHVFTDIAKEKPLSISQAAFTPAAFNTAMDQSGVYRCAGNIFWLIIQTSKTVPIRPMKVDQIRQEFFKTPSELFPTQWTVLVGLLEDNIKNDQGYKIPSTSFGDLAICSPDEILHAPILQIADDIRSGKGDEELQKWRKLLLSIPMIFKVW